MFFNIHILYTPGGWKTTFMSSIQKNQVASSFYTHRTVYCFTGKTSKGLLEILYCKRKRDLSNNRPILHSFSSNFKPVYRNIPNHKCKYKVVGILNMVYGNSRIPEKSSLEKITPYNKLWKQDYCRQDTGYSSKI